MEDHILPKYHLSAVGSVISLVRIGAGQRPGKFTMRGKLPSKCCQSINVSRKSRDFGRLGSLV